MIRLERDRFGFGGVEMVALESSGLVSIRENDCGRSTGKDRFEAAANRGR